VHFSINDKPLHPLTLPPRRYPLIPRSYPLLPPSHQSHRLALVIALVLVMVYHPYFLITALPIRVLLLHIPLSIIVAAHLLYPLPVNDC